MSTTPGQIAKFDSTGNVTDSIITETNAGSIGIGTPNPSKPLTIQAGAGKHGGSVRPFPR